MRPINQVHYFYQGDQLYLELGAEQSRSLLRTVHGPLAQVQQLNGQASVGLLATDRQGSVLSLQNGLQTLAFAYSVFGSAPRGHEALSLLGFNQQRRDPRTGCYLLGNGYRAYNPILMRFHSPDSLSPFGEGGINGYAYCGGDPVNWEDSSGHDRKPMVGKKTSSQELKQAKHLAEVNKKWNDAYGATPPPAPKDTGTDINNNSTKRTVSWSQNLTTVTEIPLDIKKRIYYRLKASKYLRRYIENPRDSKSDRKATVYDLLALIHRIPGLSELRLKTGLEKPPLIKEPDTKEIRSN